MLYFDSRVLWIHKSYTTATASHAEDLECSDIEYDTGSEDDAAKSSVPTVIFRTKPPKPRLQLAKDATRNALKQNEIRQLLRLPSNRPISAVLCNVCCN